MNLLSPEGNNGADGDYDNDGESNFREWIADTNPNDDESFLSLLGISFNGPGVAVKWKGGRQAAQVLEASPAIGEESWTAIYTNTPITSVTNEVVNEGMTNATLNYRIRAVR